MESRISLTEESGLTLSRVQRGDPALTIMVICGRERSPSSWVQYDTLHGPVNNFVPIDHTQLATMGSAIGRNTSLRYLEIQDSSLLAFDVEFIEGLSRNSSINILHMGGSVLGNQLNWLDLIILNEFVAKSNTLYHLVIFRGVLGRGGSRALTSAMSSSTSLRHVTLCGCGINDHTLEEIVSGIRGNNRLEVLDLVGNEFGLAGCRALATLLEDPSHLKTLRLDRICDGCAVILADALKRNATLKDLRLYGNTTITERGWEAFSSVLCDRSSVNATYFSNHTLENVTVVGSNEELRNGSALAPLRNLLDLNRSHGANKKKIAVLKVLQSFQRIEMEDCFKWDLKVLPDAIRWFGRASLLFRHSRRPGRSRHRDHNQVWRQHREDGRFRYQIENRKLDVIFQFMKEVHALGGESC